MSDEREPRCFRRRDFVMTERDELAFSRVLREFVPDVMFFEDGRRAKSKLRLISNIPMSREGHVLIAMPSPGQEGVWHQNQEAGKIVIWPVCDFHFRRSQWEWPDQRHKWAFDPPLLARGELSLAFPCEDDEMKRFGMRVLRLVSKMTRSKMNYGLDACRWSQSGGETRRGIGAGALIDPDEKIELNKYYDDSLWEDRLPPEPTMKEYGIT